MNLVEAAWKMTIGKTAVTRAICLLVAVMTFGLLVTAAPLRHQMLLDDAYGYGAPLAEIGLSLRFFATCFTFFELLLAGGSWAVGVAIAWRKSGDWFALLTAVTLMLFGFLPPLADGLITANIGWQMSIVSLRWLCLTGLMAVFSLFPNGRFVPHWLRFVLIGWIGNAIIVSIFRPDLLADTAVLPNTGTREDALWLLFGVAWFAPIVAAQIYRYKRVSTAVERQQTKWVIFGFTITVAFSLFSAILLTGIPGLRDDPALNTMVTLILGVVYLLSALLLPLTFAFAIFRYRLWQIDYILNRTLVYGGLTGLVTAVYILLVGSVNNLLDAQGRWLVLLIAVVVAGVSGGYLKHRWQTAVDRLFPHTQLVEALASDTTIQKAPQSPWLPLMQVVWVLNLLLVVMLFTAGYIALFGQGISSLGSTINQLTIEPVFPRFLVERAQITPMLAIQMLIQVAIFALVGLFIAWQKPNNMMALLTSAMLLNVGLGFTPNLLFLPFIHPHLGIPYVVWQFLMYGNAILFLYLFPNGRLTSSRARWPLFLSLGYIFLWLPFSELTSGLATVWWPTIAIVVMAFIGLSNQVIRYRQSNLSERAQIKWIIVGFCFANVGLLLLILQPFLYDALSIDSAGHMLFNFFTLLFGLMAVFIPISIAIALLRYDLWNVDFILNRTLVYGGVTAVILLIYAVTVGGLSLLWRSQNNLFVSLLATGFIAVLFQPLRERLQRSVNRFMFGERDDPYKVLSRLGRQLQETAVPGHLLPAITQTICQTLKLPYVAVALNTADGERRLTALTGQPSTVTEEWPLLHQGELVGWLIVAPRSPQEQFTDRERQLLADIAGQAGAAAYAVRLTTALQRSRERLVLAGEEERRRIRRDLHDGLGPTLASQTFKLDATLELLETDPAAAANLLLSLKTQNQSLIADIRRLVYALRPPSLDELGLLVALQVHISQMSLGHNGLKVTVAAAPNPLPPLPAAVEVAAYRIALEGLTNVVRHAQANQCDISLELASASLSITIRDDGLGLSAGTRPGVGLVSMRERAEELGGSFVMTADNGKGTQITATLPLLEVNKATPPQLPLVMGIITEAAAWLVAKGIDQWPSPPNDHWRRRIERYIVNGELYLATLNGEAIGTIRLIWSDPYWPEETNAGYVHTLAIRNQAHGLKIGTTLLLWAMDESRRQGKQFLRLDCPIHNQRIRAYYEELGFTFCRSVEDHDYAAALYEIELSGKP